MSKQTDVSALTSAEAGAFFIAALAIAPAIWVISFNLGAYGDVFFEHLFMVWAASIAALLARLLVIALLTCGLAYVVGAKNYYVMSCHEFAVAGASLPDNCYRGNGKE